MGTGLGPGSYAIVSQGQIDAILSSKPTERRALFEETAGIGKFLARKAESMRRLDATEQNAIRVNDLLAELERRVPELDTQVRRAKRYRRVTARVRDLEILSYLRASASRREERERVAAEAAPQRERAGRPPPRAPRRSAPKPKRCARSSTRSSSNARNAASKRSARAKSPRASKPIWPRPPRGATRSTRSRTRASPTATASRANANGCARASPNSSAQLDPLAGARRRGSRPARAAATQAVADARAALDTIYADLRAGRSDRRRTRRERSRTPRAPREHAGDITRLDRRTQRVSTANATRLTARAAETRGVLDECDALIARFEARRRCSSASWHGAEGARGEAATARVAELQERYRARRERSRRPPSRGCTRSKSSKRRSKATFPERAPSSKPPRAASCNGLLGVVSNLIEVDERYARALDVAFGAGISNIVTATSEDAERAIAYLREREIGRATFLPLDTLAARDGRTLGALRGRPGIIGYAHDLVRSEDALPRHRLVPGRPRARRRRAAHRHRARARRGLPRLDRHARRRTDPRRRRDHRRPLPPRALDPRPARASAVAARTHPATARRTGSDRTRRAGREGRPRRRRARRATPPSRRPAKPKPRCATPARAATAPKPRSSALDGELTATDERARTPRSATSTTARARFAALEDDGARCGRSGRTARRASRPRWPRPAKRSRAAEAAQHEVAPKPARCAKRSPSLGDRTRGPRDAAAACSTPTPNASPRRANRRRASSSACAKRSPPKRERLDRDARSASRPPTRPSPTPTRAAKRPPTTWRSAKPTSASRTTPIARRSTAGEGSRRRLAEIDAELGMLVQTFAQNPATDEEQRDVVERYANEPDDVLRRAAAAARRAGAPERQRQPQRRSRPRRTGRTRALPARADGRSAARRARRCSRRSPRSKSSCQEQFNDTFEAVSARFTETFAQLFPGGEAKMWQTDPEHLSETRDRDRGAAAGQEDDAAGGALGRRARDDRGGADLRADQGQAVAVLPARRGRRGARRRQRRTALGDGARGRHRRADADRHAQQENDGAGLAHVRRHDAGAGRLVDHLGRARHRGDAPHDPETRDVREMPLPDNGCGADLGLRSDRRRRTRPGADRGRARRSTRPAAAAAHLRAARLAGARRRGAHRLPGALRRPREDAASQRVRRDLARHATTPCTTPKPSSTGSRCSRRSSSTSTRSNTTVARDGATLQEAIEQIDIGGVVAAARGGEEFRPRHRAERSRAVRRTDRRAAGRGSTATRAGGSRRGPSNAPPNTTRRSRAIWNRVCSPPSCRVRSR